MSGSALACFDGVVAHLADIDRRLGEAAAENWRLPRMATVDRNVLRLGAFELLFAADRRRTWPSTRRSSWPGDMARADSPAFVNGVLDRLRQGVTPTA